MKEIGQGAFGKIAKAKLLYSFGRSVEEKTVALKMVKSEYVSH